MRLTDLDAQFVADVDPTTLSSRRQQEIDGAQGVLFQCPKCAIGKPRATDGGFQGAHYVLVCFANPRGATVAPAEYDPNPRWTMSGTSLDDLTLSLSVNLDVPGATGCRWHGFVTDGDAR